MRYESWTTNLPIRLPEWPIATIYNGTVKNENNPVTFIIFYRICSYITIRNMTQKNYDFLLFSSLYFKDKKFNSQIQLYKKLFEIQNFLNLFHSSHNNTEAVENLRDQAMLKCNKNNEISSFSHCNIFELIYPPPKYTRECEDRMATVRLHFLFLKKWKEIEYLKV